MRIKHYFIGLCLLLIFCSTSALALTEEELKKVNDGNKISLTIEKCIEIGLVYSRSYYASLMDVQQAEAKYKETQTKQLPTLKFEGTYTRLSKIPPFDVSIDIPGVPPMHFTISDAILDNYNMKLTVQQPLFTGFALSNGVKAARYAALATKQIYAKDRLELIYNIKNAYWNLYKANEFKRLIDENVDLIQAHYNDVQRFFNQGLSKLNDVLKVQVQLSNMKVSQLEAKHRVRMANMALNSLLGISLDKEIELASKINVVDEPLSEISAEVQKALTQRNEIKAMDFSVKAANAGIKIAKSGYYPQVFLVGNYNYSNPNQRIMPIEKKFQDTWDITLGMTFDIWNWRSTSQQVNQANSQLLKVKAQEAQLKDMVTLEVQQNYFDLLQAREKIEMSETSVKQAEENYRITNERFKAGLTTNSELLDAEVALLNTKVSRTEAFIDHELARARLHKSTGNE